MCFSEPWFSHLRAGAKIICLPTRGPDCEKSVCLSCTRSNPGRSVPEERLYRGEEVHSKGPVGACGWTASLRVAQPES